MRGLFSGGIADRLGSVGTALVAIFGIVALSMAGTLFGPLLENASAGAKRVGFLLGLWDTFRSPPFIVAGVLLATNVGVCTWRRTFHSGGSRRQVVRWLDGGTHLGLVIMILGGAGKALLEQVGTEYLFVDTPVTVVRDPVSGADLPLGFEVVLRERRTEYYPLSVRIGVRDAATGEKLGLLELDEGETVALEGTDLSVGMRGTTGDGTGVRLEARSGTAKTTLQFRLKDGTADTDRAGRYRLVLVAYHRLVRTVRGRIDIREEGRTVRDAWLEVNGGVVHRGIRISIIAWSRELRDEEFLGIQCSRDPTAPLFWTGTIVLCTFLPLFIVARRRRLEPR